MFDECIHNINKDRWSVIFPMFHGQLHKERRKAVSMFYIGVVVIVLRLREIVAVIRAQHHADRWCSFR